MVIPFKAIFNASGLGATLNAVAQLDFLVDHEQPQALGEIHHAFFLADADGVAELGVFLVEDQLPDGGIGPHDLVGRNSRRSLGGQLLGRRQAVSGP